MQYIAAVVILIRNMNQPGLKIGYNMHCNDSLAVSLKEGDISVSVIIYIYIVIVFIG